MLLQISKTELEKGLLIKDAKWYKMSLKKVTAEKDDNGINILMTFYIPEIDREVDRNYNTKWSFFLNPIMDAWKVEKTGALINFDPEKYIDVPVWGKIEHRAGQKNPGQLFNDIANFLPGDWPNPNEVPF